MRTAIIISAAALGTCIGSLLGIAFAEGVLRAMGYPSLTAFLLRSVT